MYYLSPRDFAMNAADMLFTDTVSFAKYTSIKTTTTTKNIISMNHSTALGRFEHESGFQAGLSVAGFSTASCCGGIC